MAARYLLLEFDDEASAERLRQQIDAATRGGKKFRVIGYFAKPTAPYCRCGKEVTTRNEKSTQRRGRKFGWYVCTVCKRPSSMVSGLVNLIRPRDIIDPVMHENAYSPEQNMLYPLSLSLLPRRKDAD